MCRDAEKIPSARQKCGSQKTSHTLFGQGELRGQGVRCFPSMASRCQIPYVSRLQKVIARFGSRDCSRRNSCSSTALAETATRGSRTPPGAAQSGRWTPKPDFARSRMNPGTPAFAAMSRSSCLCAESRWARGTRPIARPTPADDSLSSGGRSPGWSRSSADSQLRVRRGVCSSCAQTTGSETKSRSAEMPDPLKIRVRKTETRDRGQGPEACASSPWEEEA